MDGAPVGAGGTIIYFICNDCAEAAKRAKEAGGHIVKDKFSIGDYGNIALVSDPDGNVVGFPWPNRPLPEPNPETKKKDVVWFALNEDRPLFAFGGLWTEFKGDRGTKSRPLPGPEIGN